MTNGFCELEECDKPAVGFWHAAWTVADFMDVESCEEDRYWLEDILASRTTDGEPVVELYFTWYDDLVADKPGEALWRWQQFGL